MNIFQINNLVGIKQFLAGHADTKLFMDRLKNPVFYLFLLRR